LTRSQRARKRVLARSTSFRFPACIEAHCS